MSDFMGNEKHERTSEGASTPVSTESNVDVSKLVNVCQKVFRNWNWTSNGGLCSRGTRIILGWNPDMVDIMILSQSDQVIHTQILSKADKKFTELLDVKGHGLHFTWNQKPKDGVGFLKKIDRVMGNVKFLEMVPDAFVMYHPFRVSDHTPCILKMVTMNENKPRPFKFPNFITTKPEFRKCVELEWSKSVQGVTMFSVTKKLSNLKPHLRKILYKQGNLHTKVTELRKKLDDIHVLLDKNPLDASTRRNARNKIHSVKDSAGNRYEGNGVADALVAHYSNFLGVEDQVAPVNLDDLFLNVLSSHAADNMVRQITREEIKMAMFNIGDNKAPGPDGYTSAFFKQAWDIVGNEVTDVVLAFFENGKLLKQINHTILALIPKKETPYSVLDYRPISCCNDVLYKCISKIITDRIKGSLVSLVSINQSAFVPGRKVSDNILLTQELMHNYHLNRGPARCAFKIDILESL
ncbi:uncharacterized protein LOC110914543 [Helianthus annuus]|uniref:uncharacterized protein LOC110914543 n=1 Tax=Helianthus annuus TaxID=4232 RepID=UPI000B8F6464|nr:uncharacterized protein LOC110914543 [Helianthus annuus]